MGGGPGLKVAETTVEESPAVCSSTVQYCCIFLGKGCTVMAAVYYKLYKDTSIRCRSIHTLERTHTTNSIKPFPDTIGVAFCSAERLSLPQPVVSACVLPAVGSRTHASYHVMFTVMSSWGRAQWLCNRWTAEQSKEPEQLDPRQPPVPAALRQPTPAGNHPGWLLSHRSDEIIVLVVSGQADHCLDLAPVGA